MNIAPRARKIRYGNPTMPRPRPSSRVAHLWEVAIFAAMAVLVAALMTLAVIDNHAGSSPLNAAPSPEAVDPTSDPFDMLPRSEAEIIEAKRLAEERFAQMWAPKTKPRTSGKAAYITGLSSCDRECERRQTFARLDAHDKFGFIDRYADGGDHYRKSLDGISDGSGQVKHYGDRLERDRRHHKH